MTIRLAAILTLLSLSICGCGGQPEGEREAGGSGAHSIQVQATPADDERVRFVVTTDIPLPVEIMASVNLASQKDDDVFIGTDGERMTLTEPRTEFILEAVDIHGEKLPDGEYEGEVSFYPRWGARNEAAKDVPETTGLSAPFRLGNADLSAEEAKRRNERQRWVMQNVIAGTPWDEARIAKRLGPYAKSRAELSRLHDAYYFPETDMTLIVNRPKGEVTVWRKGRETR